MTTAPSAPATILPHHRGWHRSCSSRKPVPGKKPSQVSFPREHYFTSTGSKSAELLAAKIGDTEVVSSVPQQRLPLLPQGTGREQTGCPGSWVKQ